MIATAWPHIQTLLKDGVNLIPLDGHYMPLGKWKEFQTKKITQDQLFYELNKDSSASGNTAMVMGPVSDNLFCIDIDTKYNVGFDAIFFKDIQNLFPEMWNRLRIHKTKSNGYHFIYRLTDTPPPSRKLASRPTTEQEQNDYRAKNPNSKTKYDFVCFLESRGTGSTAAAHSNVGYSIHKDAPIPVLTDNEHASLLRLAESYNEQIKIEKPFTPARNASDYYDEDPWTHFNASPEAERVLENNGWVLFKQSQKFTWYTRPGAKEKQVHAAFNRERRVYFIFTTSTNFESEKGYLPATALAMLQFNNDKKATYAHLIDSGFGKVKPRVEQRKAVSLAKVNAPAPANFSVEAKELHAATVARLKEAHPYGVFWKYEDTANGSKIFISREMLMVVSAEIGFRILNDNMVQVIGQIVYDRSERQFQDHLKAYIKLDDPAEYEDVCNAYEAFMQRSCAFTIKRLPLIDKHELIRDTRNTCFKFFKNGIIKITADGVTALDYTDVEKYIHESKIKPRDYNFFQGGKYPEFLNLAMDFKNKRDHIMKCIGYMAHDYRDDTTGYIVVLTEQCEDPANGGGSGKNVFCKLFSNTITYHNMNGIQVDPKDVRFLQSWKYQRLLSISDVPEHFDLSPLKEPSSGDVKVKFLHKNEFDVPCEDGPKYVLQTNYSYKVTDGGLKRRVINIEFTDFFTKAKGIDAHFGVHFPNGWTDEDWHGFDTTIIEGVELWLKSNLKLNPSTMTETGFEKQFNQTFGTALVDFIKENIDTWKASGFITSKQILADCHRHFESEGLRLRLPSSKKIAAGIKFYCERNDFEVSVSHQQKIMGINERGFKF